MSQLLQQLEQALQAPYDNPDNPEELRIANAAELFAALSSSDIFTRLSVLEAIALDPQAALALGSDGDTDLIAILRQELDVAYGSELRLYTLFALAALPSDARLTQALEQVWFLSDDTNERLAAVSRLAREGDPAVRSHLGRTLLDDDPDRAQMVANVWNPQPEDSPKLGLRLALAAEQGDKTTPALEEYLELWLLELGGPFAGHARNLLGANPQTVETLTPVWIQLSRENRAWLLELATRFESPQRAALTQLALAEATLQLEALQAIEASPATDAYAEQLLELAEHSPNPLVQAAAIQAGAPGDNRFRAVKAAVRTVRVAAIRKLGLRDQDTLLELLHDPDWRIRSASADRLTALGEPAMQAVRPLLEHPRLEVRMAAARVMYG